MSRGMRIALLVIAAALIAALWYLDPIDRWAAEECRAAGGYPHENGQCLEVYDIGPYRPGGSNA